jgi:uncharacterized protein (TIGR02452 family)
MSSLNSLKPTKVTDYFQKRSGSKENKAEADKEKPSKKPGKGGSGVSARRARLRVIAGETLEALEEGKYFVDGTAYDLTEAIEYVMKHTAYFAPDCFLSKWAEPTSNSNQIPRSPCIIRVEERTTLSAACHIHHSRDSLGLNANSRIGVLNFASAKKEGGGFINGAQAQEESIARASTIYPSLMTAEGQRFYKLHREDNKRCYYTHAMIYSPKVHVIRDDDSQDAKWHSPVVVDILTSPAVNAGVVMSRTKDVAAEKERIKEVMIERMARILFLFEHKGVDALVLGSFGTGVFKNDITTIAGIWKSLLGPGGRFEQSFRHVVFGVIPNDTYLEFKDILGPSES